MDVVSGLNKQPAVGPTIESRIPQIGLVDPTVELSQPGGPFPYGEAILTDGAGGYTIAQTLRPYLITFCFSKYTGVTLGGCDYCDHQGMSTDLIGVPIPFGANIIGVAVSLSHATKDDHRFLVEIFKIMDRTNIVIATLDVGPDVRRAFRRDLSVELEAGAEVGVRLRHTVGETLLPFTKAIISLELEG